MWTRIAVSTVFCAVQLAGFWSAQAQHPALVGDRPINTILFGSCIKQDRPMPIFRSMSTVNADLLVMLGDNIYADTEDMQVMRAKYGSLAANQDFATFRDAVPILATWDDHDYGVNDGGASYAMRDAAQQEFLDFWDVPKDSVRRKRRGVYYARVIGPIGKRVQIILLDTRYFRSPLKTGERRVGGPYYPDSNPDKTMLGDEQWAWLEKQLKKPAELRLIASSIQCLPEASGQETWSNLPLERQRLFDLISDTSAEGVILVSGDRHWSELSVLREDVPYPLYELTSSSFNQTHARGTPTENRFRAIEKTYHKENFGVIQIDWDAAPPIVRLQIRDLDGQIQIEQTITTDQLK